MLRKREQKPARGFTLIEVVIVLAIAGLIFVIVFIAVSQAQQSQRDTRRRTSMGILQSAIIQYSTNNSGKLPQNKNEIGTLVIDGNYLDESEFVDPSEDARFDTIASGPGSFTYRTDFQCNGTDTATAGGGGRAFAIEFVMEAGQGCMDSQ